MNWLGDSKPNFPAQISGFLYAQVYATPVKRTRFGILVLRAPFSWELPFGLITLPQQGSVEADRRSPLSRARALTEFAQLAPKSLRHSGISNNRLHISSWWTNAIPIECRYYGNHSAVRLGQRRENHPHMPAAAASE